MFLFSSGRISKVAYTISSGETSDGIILTNNSMSVLNGGTATNTTVNSFGYLTVSSVKVKGVTADQVFFKFGSGNEEDAARFASLSDAGAFDAFTSRMIFEESGAGILASL